MTRLIVNGEERQASSDARMPLLWVLRDEFGCSSPKYGCGLEQCGACRVLLEGVPTASCRITLGDVDGRSVSTLEGLRQQPAGRRVVETLIGANVGQCAYCIPGIAVTLTGLAERRPATWAEVLRALDDHLCRCGSQPRILKAARLLLGFTEGAA